MKKADRIEVYKKCDGHCGYCGKSITIKEMQVDHIEPQWKAKDPRYFNLSIDINHSDNLMPSCRRCNHYKRSDNLEQFREKMKTIHDRILKSYINKVGYDYGIITITPFSGQFYFEQIK